ncbi:MAG: agmatinase [Anaerolineae bacterium]|nr:agmatinase [Anaerolineae bacterium]
MLVLPIPFEATVSYGSGTRHGPAAIIEASQQVELYDREFDREPATEYGVHTLPALELAGEPEAAVAQIAAATATAAASGKLVVGLGGEHTVSVGFGRGLLDAVGSPITVVQIDAHSDLRDEYEGTPLSHACVARRLAEFAPIVQLGIRSICQDEADYIAAHSDRVTVVFADDIHTDGGAHLMALADRVRDQRVYLTLDVDGLDPSIMPATGTPEPGGLSWAQTLDILRVVAANAEVIGCDIVELAPIPGLHAPDFIAARLAYKLINLVMQRRRRD